MSFSQGPFYANVNDSGGGFVSPYGGSQGSPSDGSKRSDRLSLRPLTILAMHNAQQAHGEANFTVDGIEIGQVTAVAQVVEAVDPQATNMLFRIDDGTARIDARHWLEAHEKPTHFAHITEGSYVRVMGTLKQIGNKRHLTAPTIRLASPKEFLFHQAEVMVVWARVTLGLHAPGGDGAPSAYAPGGGLAQAADSANYAHLPVLERNILECIRNAPQSDDGVNIEIIVETLGTKGAFNAGDLSAALDRLLDEGHIFASHDDNHFKVA